MTLCSSAEQARRRRDLKTRNEHKYTPTQHTWDHANKFRNIENEPIRLLPSTVLSSFVDLTGSEETAVPPKEVVCYNNNNNVSQPTVPPAVACSFTFPPTQSSISCSKIRTVITTCKTKSTSY